MKKKARLIFLLNEPVFNTNNINFLWRIMFGPHYRLQASVRFRAGFRPWGAAHFEFVRPQCFRIQVKLRGI